MKIIGITGPSGSGKSTVAEIAKELGFAVIDCDKTARRVTEKGSETLAVLSENFGKDIILADGSLDRKALAARAFNDAEKTGLLNRIVLPAVVALVEAEIEEYKANGAKCVVLDAPTLYESGADGICDRVLAVLSPRELRRKRIIERDGLTEEQTDARLAAAKPDSFYRDRTDLIITNDGDIAAFKQAARRVFEDLGE